MLELSGVSVNFGAMRALDDVSLRVAPGELVALTGEPGAGKTALVRLLAGDLAASAGTVILGGTPFGGGLRAAERSGIAVVWQDIALCENLDVAGNLLLGLEGRRIWSPWRMHRDAAAMLAKLGIPGLPTDTRVSRLTAGQRRLLSLGMALARGPRLLVLDEPTLTLGAAESAAVEQLLLRVRREGIGVLLVTRDVAQMFRIANRIVVLRHGRVVAGVEAGQAHPDEIALMLAGGEAGSSPRDQLARLHGLADSLARTDPSFGTVLILSALAAALGVDRDRITMRDARELEAALRSEPPGRLIVRDGVWLIPVSGSAGISAVILVSRDDQAAPSADQRDLIGLYAGYAAAAIERLEAELAQREAAALRRSRELQRIFLSRLSHELRTPLTAIRGYATSLAAPDITWDDESERRFVERIGAESARLGRLVDDLLDFSAIESGVMRLNRDWCELQLVVEAAIACLPGDGRNLVTLDGESPAIWADHDRLEQVFVNLIGNALRHNPDGTRVTVTVRSLPGAWAQIIVADDGPGMPAVMRAAPFDQAARPRSATAGAGLGLSIARGIVDAHGGEIELLAGGEGTRFRIELPLEAAADGPGDREQAEPSLSGVVRDA